ncbi:hypothetical protein PRK78_002691 [Emydomyces testavorans]|uniref:Uncharacterized protein n=1 Tax=Emydomyces testavorans TaxID=2070801 RepID=A0AAF0DFL2_9EURO|nr:hypothetical protein PRK78_002691 [Emydomyces testavorans]
MPHADPSPPVSRSTSPSPASFLITRHRNRISQFPGEILQALNEHYLRLETPDIEDLFCSINNAIITSSSTTPRVLSTGLTADAEPDSSVINRVPASTPESPLFDVVVSDTSIITALSRLNLEIDESYPRVELANDAVMELFARYHGELLCQSSRQFIRLDPGATWDCRGLRRNQVLWLIDPVDASLQLIGFGSRGDVFRIFACRRLEI